MKKVLVTGGSGFVGRHVIPLLVDRGYEVHAVSIKLEETMPDIRWHVADLLNPGDAEALIAKIQPTHLLHLSWVTAVGKFWTSPENIRWVQASLEVLRAFAANCGQRMVVAGTCAEYKWDYKMYSEETTPLLPATLYGACKHALQIMVDAFSKQTGLSYAWGRIFFLYGPHEHPDRLVASVIRSLLRGEPARCSHGNQIRDILHVEDVARAFALLLDSDVQGALNIGRGVPVTIREVVELIGELLQSKQLLRMGSLSVPLSEPPALIADVRRLTSIGWYPKYDLKAGLEQTIAWWKMNSLTPERAEK